MCSTEGVRRPRHREPVSIRPAFLHEQHRGVESVERTCGADGADRRIGDGGRWAASCITSSTARPNPRNTILIVGFQAEHTLGRRIVERQPVIRVLGNEVELRATVEIINGYSAHADRTEFAGWLDAVRKTSPGLRRVYLVHGEEAAQAALSESLGAQGYAVTCPVLHQKIRV